MTRRPNAGIPLFGRHRPTIPKSQFLRCVNGLARFFVSIHRLRDGFPPLPSTSPPRFARLAAASTLGGVNKGKVVAHLSVRLARRRFTLQQDNSPQGRGPERFTCSFERTPNARVCYWGGWGLWLEGAAGDEARLELELGRFALSF